MRVEALAVTLRARQGWEAIDLGFRMAAYWAKPLWSVWLVIYLPLACAILLALRDQPLVAALLIWWLKPMPDRFALFVLSRRVFGDPASLAQTLAAWRSVLSPGLLRALILRPFGWDRSVLQAVPLLERQRGAAARKRTGVLNRRLGGHAMALAFVCLCFELVLMISIAMIGALLIPAAEVGGASAESGFAEALGVEWWGLGATLAYAAAVALVEPFFVAAGFAMYLVRRTQLEGWDIELALRRAAVVGADRRVVRTASLMLIFVVGAVIGAGALVSPTANAQNSTDVSASIEHVDAASDAQPEQPTGPPANNAITKRSLRSFDEQADGASAPPPPLDSAARRTALEILAHREFGREVEHMRWRLDIGKDEREPSAANIDWLRKVGDWLAAGLRVAAWLLLAALGIAVIWLMARHFGDAQLPILRDLPPSQLFGLEIDPDSLPDDVVAAALAALNEGRARDAVSLLYRGALSFLVHECAMRISEGAVEGEVLGLAKGLLSKPATAHFEQLIAAWVAIAYGHREVDVDHLRALCHAHRRCFNAALPTPPPVPQGAAAEPAEAST